MIPIPIIVLQKGTSFWFYTWQDCDLIYSTRTDPAKYCDGPVDCGRYAGGDLKALGKQLTQLAGYYAQFRGNNEAWQQEYAYGHCKLNNMGAIYSEFKVRSPVLPAAMLALATCHTLVVQAAASRIDSVCWYALRISVVTDTVLIRCTTLA